MNQKNSYFSTGIDMLDKHTVPFKFDDMMLYVAVLLDLSKGRSDIPDSEFNRRGYFTLLNGDTGSINFTVPFGVIPVDKDNKYFKLSQEKALRLFYFINKNMNVFHTSSFESRNEEEGKFGGAIFADYHCNWSIFSFSGMPELIDEAMMICLAMFLSETSAYPIIQKIEAISRNPYWESLYKDFKNHRLILPALK